MSKEVYGLPVTQRIVQPQKQKSHTHVVKGAHLEEPAGPVEALDPSLRAVSERCSHIVLRHQYDGHEQEAEVVAGVYPVPERTHRHGYCNSEISKQKHTCLQKHYNHKIRYLTIFFLCMCISRGKTSFFNKRHLPLGQVDKEEILPNSSFERLTGMQKQFHN